MRRARSGWIAAAAIVAVSCAGESTDDASLLDEQCSDVCTAWRGLACWNGPSPFENPLGKFLSIPVACEESCRELPAVTDLCDQRYRSFVDCVWSHGVECGQQPPRPTVTGCDEQAFAYCEACGCCAAPPSGNALPCPNDEPLYLRCAAPTSPAREHPACYPACAAVAPGAYCCSADYHDTPCNPGASAGCDGCD